MMPTRLALLHGVLFLLTLISTSLVAGFWYSIPLMSILFLHEMGHYMACRKYGIRATLPFFVPFPLPPLGTMGAVILIRSPIRTRKALFDVGCAGPLLGFAAIVPILIVGISLSGIVPDPGNNPEDPLATINEPLLFKAVVWLLGIHIPEGHTLLIHPLAFAAWVGCLVTGLNLIPVGQLDGGHILFALIGRRAKRVSWLILAALAALTVFVFGGWLLFVVLLAVFARRHPPILDESEPLGRERTVLGTAMLVLFALLFIPAPFPGVGPLSNVFAEFMKAFH